MTAISYFSISNSSSDCDERRFMITSRAHVDVKKECEGVTALLDSGGVLEVRWLNANDENIDESGGSSSVLEVTYDPAVVGLRYILESLVKSNPQFSVSLMKRKVPYYENSCDTKTYVLNLIVFLCCVGRRGRVDGSTESRN